MRDSFLVQGVAFKKTFSYAGFEQQPKKFVDPKILILNIELELKSEKENAEVRYTTAQSCQDQDSTLRYATVLSGTPDRDLEEGHLTLVARSLMARARSWSSSLRKRMPKSGAPQ